MASPNQIPINQPDPPSPAPTYLPNRWVEHPDEPEGTPAADASRYSPPPISRAPNESASATSQSARRAGSPGRFFAPLEEISETTTEARHARGCGDNSVAGGGASSAWVGRFWGDKVRRCSVALLLGILRAIGSRAHFDFVGVWLCVW